jgi:hypothetical protein
LVTWGDTSAESWTNWHPEFLIQLDRIIRKSTPKNTVIFSGHRVWWLLSCSEVSINLKTFQRRVIRNLRKYRPCLDRTANRQVERVYGLCSARTCRSLCGPRRWRVDPR